MKLYVLTFLVIFSSSQKGFTQSISYSPYSYYGIGILKERTSALNRSLAETGTALRDPMNLNMMNPASYTSIEGATQLAEMGMFYETSQLESNKLSQLAANGNMTALNLWFRYHKKWAGVIGLAPFSFVNYNMDTQKEFTEGQLTHVNYNGKSGLSQFYLGNAYQVTKNFSLGANLTFIFGSLQKEEQVLSGNAYGLHLNDKISLSKLTIDWGAQYSFKFSKYQVNLGLTYSDKIKLNAAHEIRVSEGFGQDSLFTLYPKKTDYYLPRQLGFGVAFQSNRIMFAADMKYKNWKDAQLENNTKLRDTYRLSTGIEYKGDPKSVRYFDAISFRAGLSFQNNYLIINSTPFDEWGYTLGFGLPLNRNRGTLSLSYSPVQLGTKEKGMIQQSSNVVVIDITFRDLWGIRPKLN